MDFSKRYKTGYLLYVTVPAKCGSRTLQKMMHNSTNDHYYIGRISYMVRVAILRNPVDRIKSFFSHWILDRNQDNIKKEINSLSDLLENLVHLQKKYHWIDAHTRKYYEVLHPNFVYDKFFKTADISTTFLEYLNSVCDIPVDRIHLNISNSSNVIHTNSDKILIENIYAKDYDLYSKYF
jgi:hypothetical protein